MSNIVLHSTHATPALKNDTNFVNLFLDNLIENYCNKRYTENVSYPNLRFPTLDELILEAYPAYYIKSYGLLGHNTTTNVLKIYDEDLHCILVNALEHKFSRLFINISNIAREFVVGASSLHNRSNKTVLPVMGRSALNQKLNNRAVHKLKAHQLFDMITESSSSIMIEDNKFQLVYKPNLEAIQQLSDSLKLKNQAVFDVLDFFDIRSAYSNDYVARLAFTIIDYNNDILKDNLHPEFFKRLQEMSIVIVNHIYAKVDKAKNEIIEHERRIEQDRIHKRARELWDQQVRIEKKRAEEEEKRKQDEYDSHFSQSKILKEMEKNKKENADIIEYTQIVENSVNKSISNKDIIALLIVSAIIILPPMLYYIF